MQSREGSNERSFLPPLPLKANAQKEISQEEEFDKEFNALLDKTGEEHFPTHPKVETAPV